MLESTIDPSKLDVLIVGAGPAGLTAGYSLCKHGARPIILEADPHYVGGISRTETYKGYHFDIGGHRFFSKAGEVEALWTEILGDELIVRPRKSRIYYKRKFFSYPLKPTNALLTLGALEAARCVSSYAYRRLRPIAAPKNFEDWVTNQFGTRLYEIFFKSYTEKVWGMSCREISADWAAQRIKGLSLASAIKNAIRPQPKGGEVIKTLIDQFRYPRRGPGMLWETCTERIKEAGGDVRMGCRVSGLRFDGRRWQVQYTTSDGRQETASAEHVINSAPLRDIVRGVQPEVPAEVRRAAEGLRYRDFLTVALITRDKGVFDDNWIYIQDADVKVGRIQNFKAWSPEMVPDPAMCCYGLEYFCFEGDGLWSADDEELISLGKRELEQLGLGLAADVTDGCVVRQPKAYPVYDAEYERNVDTIRRYLEQELPSLHPVGRNGMHRYNNQDHSMMTAMLTVQNLVANRQVYDTWRVNQDAQYIEAGAAGAEQLMRQGGRSIPRRATGT